MQLLLLVLLICCACTSPVDVCQAGFGHDGDDRRRRPPKWADWKHDGHVDVFEDEDDNDVGDSPEIWMGRARKLGYAKRKHKTLRRTFFLQGKAFFCFIY